MRRNILLSFCLLCACSISACSSFSSDRDGSPDAVIDATVNPYDKCGVDGISCNDSALINYTKTEADYKAYGERTKRDHLYTQAQAGNNLTSTIRPTVEEDVVTEYEPEEDFEEETPQPDAFDQAAVGNVEPQYPMHNIDPYQVGLSSNLQVYCQTNCDQFSIAGGANQYAFTEAAFDMNDYIKENGDENIEFVAIGERNDFEDIEVAEVEITDDTILTWDAKEGDNLKKLLTEWSARSGWKLLWNTNRNYTLNAGVVFKGTFTDVSSALIRAFARARPAPIATFYKGNRVIVVETMENENAY